MTTPFEAGKKAALEGKSVKDNPYIVGMTKLGNARLSEGGSDWEAGFNSTIIRIASQKEIDAARTVDVSRFRRKSNRYYNNG